MDTRRLILTINVDTQQFQLSLIGLIFILYVASSFMYHIIPSVTQRRPTPNGIGRIRLSRIERKDI